jgi:pimeloyl-ACP methyl ester carboxylesterase
VASIRYDKLGTGATGLGPYASAPEALSTRTYDELRVQPARDALAFLADQPGIDPTRLIVVGHSEGGMVALALDHAPGDGPRPAGLALLEPQYRRILDIISLQLADVLAAQVRLGAVDAADGAVLTGWLDAGIAEIRTGVPPFPGPGPDPLPDATGVTASLQAAIRSSVYSDDPLPMVQTQAVRDLFGKGADELDPVALAGSVAVPTLVTCGTRDVETPCALGGAPGSGVAALAAALPPSTTELVVAPGTVHLLRDVGDADADPGLAELVAYPYSTVIEAALEQFVASFAARPPSPSTTTASPPAVPAVALPRFAG